MTIINQLNSTERLQKPEMKPVQIQVTIQYRQQLTYKDFSNNIWALT